MLQKLIISLLMIITVVGCQEAQMQKEGERAVKAFIAEMNPELAKKITQIETEITLSEQKIKKLSELRLKHPNHVTKIEFSLQKWTRLQYKLTNTLKEISEIVESAYVTYELDRIQGGKQFNKMSQQLLTSADTVLNTANATKTVIEQGIHELETPPPAPNAPHIISPIIPHKREAPPTVSLLPQQLYKELKGHTGDINSIAFSADGQMIVSGSNDNTVKFWDIKTFKIIKTLRASDEDILTVALYGNILATAGNDHHITLWDLKTYTQTQTLKGHHGVIHSLAFSSDGHTLISGSWDKTIRIWDITSATEIRHIQTKDSIYTVALHPSGDIIVAGSFDETITLWETKTGKLLRTLQGNGMLTVYSVAFSPNGKQIISGDLSNTVRIWDADTGKSLWILNGDKDVFGGVFSVAYSPNGEFIASGSGDETVRLWHAETGKKLFTHPGSESEVRVVVFSPNGHILASGHDDNTIKLWHHTLKMDH